MNLENLKGSAFKCPKCDFVREGKEFIQSEWIFEPVTIDQVRYGHCPEHGLQKFEYIENYNSSKSEGDVFSISD